MLSATWGLGVTEQRAQKRRSHFLQAQADLAHPCQMSKRTLRSHEADRTRQQGTTIHLAKEPVAIWIRTKTPQG
jgi:hypothetical protein